MTRSLRVHDGVEGDLFEVFSYYAVEAPTQVDRFYDLFVNATVNIQRHPFVYPLLFGHYRHVVLVPFQHFVAYQVTDTTIDILAVRHGKENPTTLQASIGSRTID